MMRMPAPHYRLAAGYTGGYDDRPGRAALMRIARRIAHANRLEIVSEYAMPAVRYDCFVMRVSSTEPLEAVRTRIAALPSVALVQPMQSFHTLAHDDPLYPLQPAGEPWHLATLHAIATGRDVAVASIDTGVDTRHRDLAGQVAETRDFVDSGSFPEERHGTAVAGVIAGVADNGIGIAGVAPKSRLVVLRACWETAPGSVAKCNSFTLAKALQFAIDRRASVINMSLTGPSDRLLSELIDNAVARGIVVVGAVDSNADDGGFPASHAGIIPVASDGDRPRIAGALSAPGHDVPATVPGGGWDFVNGASFSTAEVSGMVALMRELAPRMTPQKIRAALTSKRGEVNDNANVAVDPCSAIALTGGICACNCTQKNQQSTAPVH